jgi:hypothetical protein
MKLSQLKEILKETVREVVREEMRNVLREEITPTPIKETIKPKNIVKPPTSKKYKSSGDPIQDLLNETAEAGEWKTMGSYTAQDAQTFMGNFQDQLMEEPAVTDVGSFINNNKNQTGLAHHQIQINEVPDFSNIMNTMKSKGII